jgi:hypothetical protein
MLVGITNYSIMGGEVLLNGTAQKIEGDKN